MLASPYQDGQGQLCSSTQQGRVGSTLGLKGLEDLGLGNFARENVDIPLKLLREIPD